jgi:hypothetical protein
MTLLMWEFGGTLPPHEKRIYDISSGIVCESDKYLSNIHPAGQTSRKLSSCSTPIDRVSLLMPKRNVLTMQIFTRLRCIQLLEIVS